MRNICRQVILFVSIGLVSARSETNILAIHLVIGETERGSLIAGTATPAGVKFELQPVLWDRDFVSYDRTNHFFEVTAEAAKRLSNSITASLVPRMRPSTPERPFGPDAHERAFVVVAESEPVYVGAFATEFSGVPYRVPVIMFPPRLRPATTNKAKFRINFTPSPIRTVSSNSNERVDIRRDKRILAALDKLGL